MPRGRHAGASKDASVNGVDLRESGRDVTAAEISGYAVIAPKEWAADANRPARVTPGVGVWNGDVCASFLFIIMATSSQLLMRSETLPAVPPRVKLFPRIA